jgi:hypothetical protein
MEFAFPRVIIHLIWYNGKTIIQLIPPHFWIEFLLFCFSSVFSNWDGGLFLTISIKIPISVRLFQVFLLIFLLLGGEGNILCSNEPLLSWLGLRTNILNTHYVYLLNQIKYFYNKQHSLFKKLPDKMIPHSWLKVRL